MHNLYDEKLSLHLIAAFGIVETNRHRLGPRPVGETFLKLVYDLMKCCQSLVLHPSDFGLTISFQGPCKLFPD
jgi:hypothetical protein